MSKRALKRLTTVVCFVVSVIFLWQSTAYAEEVQYTDNIIPAMTSDTSPSGEASASGVYYDTKYPAYMAFDHISNTISSAWVCEYGSSSGWLAYEFENEKCVTKYTLVSRNPVVEITEMPKTWTFEGYDEETDSWVVLDKQTNVTTWTISVKKEFTFTNKINYKKYRINVNENCDSSHHLVIGELEMMETVSSSNLKATGGTSKVDLTWDTVDKATSYTIKRSTTAGGPYTTIATDIAETSYKDTDVTSGTTYYYIVTAVNTGTEITDSNEASAAPTADQTPPTTEAKLKVVLEVAESLRLSVDDDINVNTQMAWSSSDPTVATVNEKGIVTALATGNTVITVKSVDGSYTDYINVLVVENAYDYRLAIDLKVGETARLTVDDFTNTANITWAPMDSSIANVTTKGKVTALSKGLVLIAAKDADGNIIGRVYVRVRE